MGFGFFSRPASSAGGANDRGVDTPEVTTEPTVRIEVVEQIGKDAHPGAVAAPTAEAVVDGLPRSIA